RATAEEILAARFVTHEGRREEETLVDPCIGDRPRPGPHLVELASGLRAQVPLGEAEAFDLPFFLVEHPAGLGAPIAVEHQAEVVETPLLVAQVADPQLIAQPVGSLFGDTEDAKEL